MAGSESSSRRPPLSRSSTGAPSVALQPSSASSQKSKAVKTTDASALLAKVAARPASRRANSSEHIAAASESLTEDERQAAWRYWEAPGSKGQNCGHGGYVSFPDFDRTNCMGKDRVSDEVHG